MLMQIVENIENPLVMHGSGMDCVRMLYPVLPRKKKKKNLKVQI